MQLWIGTYAFPAGQCAVTSRVTGIERSDSGRPLRFTLALDVDGVIRGTGQADLSARELQLRAVLATPFQDLILRQDTGPPSSLALVSNQSLSGVVVVSGPDFYKPDGPEFVTTRHFRFSAEAVFLSPGGAAALVSWTQTVSVQGNGGPVRAWRVPINADPIRQVVTPRSIIRYTQQGSATGHTAEPRVPPPVFGRAYLMNESEAVQKVTPRPVGRNWVNYTVSWNYVFESDRPLTGTTPLPAF